MPNYFFLQWNEKFGESYKKLRLGYNFLKECRNVDFSCVSTLSIGQQQREAERQARQADMLREKFNVVCQQMVENMPEMQVKTFTLILLREISILCK